MPISYIAWKLRTRFRNYTLVLLLLIFFEALISIDCAKKKSLQVRFVNFTTTFNPELSTGVEFTVSPDTNGRAFNFNWNLSIDIPKNLHLSTNMMMNNIQANSKQTIFKYDFDLCRVMDGFMSQAIGRSWFNNLKRYGNVPVNCPVNKGFYHLKKMQLTKGSIPPLVPTGFYFTKVSMYCEKDGVKNNVFNSALDTEVLYA